MRTTAARLMVAYAVISAWPTNAAAAVFTGLGDLAGGSFHSQAWGLSADGSVVVGQSISASGIEAFRWTPGGGIVALGDLAGGSFESIANDVSADGSVIVGNGFSDSGYEAFRWTAVGGMVGLGDLSGGPYPSFQSFSYGVSDDGSVVVGSGRSAAVGGNEAFRWTDGGGMVGLGGFDELARRVSADGSVVVGRSETGLGDEAFRWTAAGGKTFLGDFSGGVFFSEARDVSADGSVVVGFGVPGVGTEAFRWTAGGGMVGLGYLSGFGSEAYGVSADGSVVVGHSAAPDRAFIWDQTLGMRSLHDVLTTDLGLDLTGWTLVQASDVSADGRTIVGYGINPSGDIEAWVAVIPEPSTVVLAVLAFAILAVYRSQAGNAR